MIAAQVLTRIEVLHKKDIIHRDIKPENLCTGLKEMSKTIYMIDFGLAKYFKTKQGKHIHYRENKGMIGTSRYSSISAANGCE